MHKTTISIEINPAHLSRYSDTHLAACWHIAQANPADGFHDNAPGDLAETIGREIIRRWLRETPPELYHHQGRHHSWWWLTQFATYQPGGPDGTPEWFQGQWMPHETEHKTAPADSDPADSGPASSDPAV